MHPENFENIGFKWLHLVHFGSKVSPLDSFKITLHVLKKLVFFVFKSQLFSTISFFGKRKLK